MQDYYLIDLTHNERAIKKEKIYEAVSRSCLKYGGLWGSGSDFVENRVREFWDYNDPYPSEKVIRETVRVRHLKWYIKNKLEVNDAIWNGSFLQGLALNGKIKWCMKRFPTFLWNGNKRVKNLIEACPFGGKFSSNWEESYSRTSYRWMSVPALYLKSDPTSIDFIAGGLAAGELVIKDGVAYAEYRGRIVKYLREWGIPFEIESECGKRVMISPIWASLVTPRMPDGFKDQWLGLENGAKVDEYAAILWNAYVGRYFVPNGIPYLKSRRWIYYHLKIPEKSLDDHLSIERVRIGLTDLDIRFRNIVHTWRDKYEVPTN